METTMTLSHLADLIIVTSFFSIFGAGLGCMVAELVGIAVGGIKKKLAERKERKERKSKALEDSSPEQPE